MEWVHDHLQLIIAIAGAIAYWIIQNKKGGEQADLPPGDYEKNFEDPELAERTRQIREEIQRKIEQRKGMPHHAPPAPVGEEGPPPLWPQPSPYSAPPPVTRLPLPTEVPRPVEPPVIREVVVRGASPAGQEAAARAAAARRAAEILEEQVALAEKLKMAEEMRAAAKRRAAFEESYGAAGEVAQTAAGATRTQSSGRWFDDLRGGPDSLRRAFVLREILGPPVGLRE